MADDLLGKLRALEEHIGGEDPFEQMTGMDELLDLLPAIIEELERLGKDARRYRHIREHCGFNLGNNADVGKFDVSQKTERGTAWYLYYEKLDEAVDAAIDAAMEE